MAQDEPIIRMRSVTKDYRGLRPLRIQALDIRRGDSIALLGFDQTTAEVLTDLITGATLPDTGEVTVLGQATSAVTEVDAWFAALDQFGMVSERAVLVDQLTAAENIGMPLTLTLQSASDLVRSTVERLGREVGLSAAEMTTLCGTLGPQARARTRLGRALALEPKMLLAEHPTAALPAADAPAFAAEVRRIVGTRGIAALLLTADEAFARAAAERVLLLQPATGALRPLSGWRRWLS